MPGSEGSIPLHREPPDALRPLIELARRHAARGQFDASVGRQAQYIFTARGKLPSIAFLFDLSLMMACAAAGLIDARLAL